MLPVLTAAPPEPTEDLPVQMPGELSEGNWAGTGLAWGTSTRDVHGVTFTFDGEFAAPVQLTVDGQTVDGLYDIDGVWSLDGRSPQAEMFGAYGGTGSGTISGDRRGLVLEGTSSSEGEMLVRSGTLERTVRADHPDRSDRLEVSVTASTCAEAYLDWDSDWNLQLDEVGWAPTYSGTFVLVLDVEELRAAVATWLENTRSGIDLDQLDPLTRPPGLPGVVIAVEGVLRSFVQWSKTSPMNPWQESAELVHDAEVVLNRLRNASPCDRYLVGESTVERFITLVTSVVARGVEELLFAQDRYLLERGPGLAAGEIEPTGGFADDLMQLLNIAARNGVIGSGAVDQVQAARIEELLRRHAEKILTVYVDIDGRIPNNPDTRGVFAIAALMGWELNVLGEIWDAEALIGNYGDQVDFALPGAGG